MPELQAKYPHTRGLTRLAYSTCGKFLFTTGFDTLIRRFLVGSPDEPDTLDADSPGLDIAASSEYFAVATYDGSAKLYDLGGSKPVRELTRSTLPIRNINFSANGSYALIAGDEGAVIVDVRDVTKFLTVNNNIQVKHATFSSNESLIGLSTIDGVAQFYRYETDPRLSLHLENKIEGLLPSIKDLGDDRTTAVAWCPGNNLFALPSKSFEIVVFSSKSYLEEFRLRIDGHENALTDIQWSPNGAYLASAGRDGRILIWDVETRTVVQRYQNVTGVLEVKWNPNSNVISFTTNLGQLYTAPAVPQNLEPPFGNVVKHPMNTKTTDERKNKRQRLLHRELEDLNEEPHSDDLWLSDVEVRNDVENSDVTFSNRTEYVSRKRPESSNDSQAPFQPGATPWYERKRYLNANTVGYVWTVIQDKTHNSVTIRFFDQSARREIHFNDEDQFDLASLTASGCLFANSKTGKVQMRFHGSFSDNWEYQCSVGDSVRAVALSEEIATICTSRGYILTFTVYGNPVMVNRQSRDPVVCCAAFENTVMTVCAGSDGLNYTLEDVSSGMFYQKNDALDVPPNNHLSAIVFTETGDPCIVDSSGTVSVLVHWRSPLQARWVPIFDGKEYARTQNKQLTFWPIGIVGNQFMCVALKGQQKWPPIPMPITSEEELFVPGLDRPESEFIVAKILYTQFKERAEHLGQLEEVQNDLIDRELDLDKRLLRQMQSACEENRVNKCLRIVAQLRQREALEAAAKIAAHFDLTTLAERIVQSIG